MKVVDGWMIEVPYILSHVVHNNNTLIARPWGHARFTGYVSGALNRTLAKLAL